MSMLKGAKTAGLAVLMAMAMAATGAGGAQAQSSVTFTGWGGITQEAVLKNLFAGADKLGITIKADRHGAWRT